MQPTLLIMAAGIGNRYGGLKQIDPVGPSGEIIIDYSIYDALRAGFKKIVFVISKVMEKDFKAKFDSQLSGKAEVYYVFQTMDNLPQGFQLPVQRIKPWGTAHAILVAQDVIQDPFLVINADDYYGRSGYQTILNYFENLNIGQSDDYSMVGFMLNNTLSDYGSVSRGACQICSAGYLQDVVEYTKIELIDSGARHVHPDGQISNFTGQETVSMNMWGFTPSIFNHLNQQFEQFLKENIENPKAEFYIPTVINNIIKNNLNKVRVFASHDEWFGITYPQDKTIAQRKINQLITKGIYPKKLF